MLSTNSTFKISAAHLSLSDLHRLFHASHDVELSEEARQKVDYCRNYLDQKIEREENPVYGINTGFGSLCNVAIEGKDLKRLQLNLVRSHACGSGDRITPVYV